MVFITKARLFGQTKVIANDIKTKGIYRSQSYCQDYAVAMAVISGGKDDTGKKNS